MRPVSVARVDPKNLKIIWDDGTECVYPMVMLRRNCPCATCTTDAQSRGPSYIPLYTGDALTLTSIEPVGYYALQLSWKDGHRTGIYTYEYLRSLCPEPAAGA